MAENSGPGRGTPSEADETQYVLRSLFFHRWLQEADSASLIERVAMLDSAAYDWSDLDSLGISATAWDYVMRRGNSAARIFCHPDVVLGDPRLIMYYRCAAGLPRKGIQRLAFNVTSLERGMGKLSPERSALLTRVLNRFISAVIDSNPAYSLADTLLLVYATAGVTADGSWRNRVGEEAIRQVKDMVYTYFFNNGLVCDALLPSDERIPPAADLEASKLRGFELTNASCVMFGSEPDVSMFNPGGNLVGVVEVKGGIDPAGALERYGASKKSFEEALRRNPRAFTVYLASCITPHCRR